MISTTTVRERPQLLAHSHTDSSLLHRNRNSPSTAPWPDKLKVTTVDISLLLKPKDDDTSHVVDVSRPSSKSSSATRGTAPVTGSPPPVAPSNAIASNVGNLTTRNGSSSRPPLTPLHTVPAGLPNTSSIPTKRPCRPFEQPSSESPAKKQSKWSPEEDAKIIQLRGDGMKWEDISKHLPGRSAISCRLHYQNYLERRSEWDEDRKNKLARLYERFKSDMWSRIAEEMAIPWRAAEAMHWQMGEQEMARRAGVTPFSLTTNLNQQQHNANNVIAQHSRPHAHMRSNSATPRMRRDSHNHNHNLGHASTPPSYAGPPPPPSTALNLAPPQLPSLAELTAGLPAYSSSSSHGQPSPPILTPPHHLHNHPSSTGYPFQGRFNSQSFPPPPHPPPPPTPTAQPSRP